MFKKVVADDGQVVNPVSIPKSAKPMTLNGKLQRPPMTPIDTRIYAETEKSGILSKCRVWCCLKSKTRLTRGDAHSTMGIYIIQI